MKDLHANVATSPDVAGSACGEPVDWLAWVFALGTRDLEAGLAEVRRAYETARLHGLGVRAQVLASMSICMEVADFGSFVRLPVWADQLADGGIDAAALAPHARLIYAGGALALHQFAPGAVGIPSAPDCIALFRTTLEAHPGAIHPNVLIATIDHVCGYLSNVREQALLGRLHGLADAVLEDERLDARMRGRWLFWKGVAHWHIDSREEAEAAWTRALASPEAADWPWLKFHLRRTAVRPVLEDGRYALARQRIDELETLLDFNRPIDLSDYHHLCGWLALAVGDARLAQQHLELAMEAARHAGMSSPGVGVAASALAQSMLCDAREDDGIALYEQMTFPAGPGGAAQREGAIAFCRAARSRRLGAPDYPEQLAIGFRCSRELGMLRIVRYAPWMAAQFCADALRHGIEPEFVARVIESRGLQPPPGTGSTWPWRIKVLTCQPFDVIVDGRPLELDGKTRSKPLALLRLLAAQAGGPVSIARIGDWIWPDQAPAQARGSFDVTLNRLRAMLGCKDALVVGDGRVALSEQIVWLDTRALTQAARRCADSMQIATAMQRRPIFEQLLQCHERAFLEVDDEEPWAVEARVRFAHLFAHSIEALVRAAEVDAALAEAHWMRERSGLRAAAATPLRLIVNR